MDLQKAKILLEKMNALFNSMNTDAASISSIEMDLMRNYTQQFYEIFLIGHQQPSPSPTRSVPTPPLPPRKKIEVIKPTLETPPPPVQEAAPPPPPPPPVEENLSKTSILELETNETKAPRVIELPDSLRDLTDEATPTPQPVQKKFNSTKVEIPEEVEELFESSQARELSEKLGELPIPDLTKAMGLNEKIFTINELFDGDQNKFNSVLQVLNGLHSYEQAKEYLASEVVADFHWTEKDKKKKAKNFIKLIRRRYN